MKGCSAVLLSGLLVVLLIFALFPPGVQGNPIPQENDSDYVGSYNITRSNLGESWTEWGEWTSLEYFFTFGGPTVCFGYHGHNYVFRSDSAHQWVEYRQDGRDCVRLIKIK